MYAAFSKQIVGPSSCRLPGWCTKESSSGLASWVSSGAGLDPGDLPVGWRDRLRILKRSCCDWLSLRRLYAKTVPDGIRAEILSREATLSRFIVERSDKVLLEHEQALMRHLALRSASAESFPDPHMLKEWMFVIQAPLRTLTTLHS